MLKSVPAHNVMSPFVNWFISCFFNLSYNIKPCVLCSNVLRRQYRMATKSSTKKKHLNQECYKPAAHNQYKECVYIGGNRIVIKGMAMQGTNWTNAYGRRSSKNLRQKCTYS